MLIELANYEAVQDKEATVAVAATYPGLQRY